MRRPLLDLLERQNLHSSGNGGLQFARAKQEVGIARFAESLVAEREGFIEQESARCRRAKDVVEDRPMEIVRHQNQIEAGALERPGRACFEIEADLRQARRVWLLVGIAVDGGHLQAEIEQKPAMPPAARGDVERPAIRACERQKALNPGGGCLSKRQSWAIYVAMGATRIAPA